ncbi:TRAP transporter small permease [Mesorhizobium xinjiangense]|uniref:TRAP transporter small permease n=1 Tax=Mesorhizobium xinjiangense TaxID=2678685 RepID=UPI0012EE7D9F|nr:TRAP transporter small permease [Mesorhizobium xinjiangense]
MLERFDRVLSRAEDVFIVTLLVTASAILFVNVVARYFFNTGLVWAEEFVRYEIVWLVFIGGSVATRKGIHIGVEMVLHMLPAPAQRLLNICVGVACVAFCLALAIYGLELVAQTKQFGQRSSAMQIPFWIVQLAIPVGAGLMALRFAQRLYLEIAGTYRRSETAILN